MHKEHNKKLDSIISSYNPDIRKHFKSLSYKSNITYFAHSITGVLINKDKIKFNKISNIQDLVNSMNGNDMLIVLDDPIELSSLIESNTSKRKNGNKNPSDVINNIRKFKSMVVDKDITIVNFYNKRMDENGFASAISWSGEAIRDISIVKSNGKNNLVFVTPKDMSIISSDILVQLVRDKKTDCAMQLLSSQDFVDEVNYQMYYFSPFISYKSLKSLDSTYHDIREQFLVYLPNAKWLDSVDKDGFERVLYEWDKLKFNAIKNKAKIQDKNISQ